MKKIIIIISTLLIFPSILFATEKAWLLWEYIGNRWSLINALNSRNECRDILVKEHLRFYNLFSDIPGSEVYPQPNKTASICLKTFNYDESVLIKEHCKTVLIDFVMRDSNKEKINSSLHWIVGKKNLSEIKDEIRKMEKEGKTKKEIEAYEKAALKNLSIIEVEFWCLPAGVDPKTIRNR